LVNAVFNRHNLTLVILDNGTTAMTGHQPHPGVDMANWQLSDYGRVDIESVVRALGVEHVTVIRPYRIKKSIAAVKEALAHPGVSVVISREMCTLFARGLKQLVGKPFRISERCKNHRDCISQLGCPAFYLDGEAVRIDAQLCTGCSVCAQVCPEKAIVPVRAEAG
jgi:indolepyruvate ferredoxin oxidoreductase alpha subunit